MPEGDTIFRAAQTLHRALTGSVVTRFESVFPALNRIDHDRPLVGRTIESVSARGKHLLMAFSGDLVLRTHMRMHGSWHIYRPGERWQRSAHDMRIVVQTSRFVAVGFNVPIAELLTSRDLSRHKELQAIGQDLLAATFDEDEVIRRLRSHDGDAIADALLNQRIVAGIGNVFKSEILFITRIHPFRTVGALSDDDLRRIVGESRRQLRANVLTRSQTLSPAFGRRTTRNLDPSVKLWVYSRGGQPCRICGTPIQARKTGLDARLTYWCPKCQPSRSG
ncbi:MAG: DNA-formamidopyrimidine glycosylase family protein [Acidobacteriota bacterium]